MENSKITNGDFVEIEFIGKVKDGDIFDTNIKSEAEKLNLKIDAKPFIICIGQGMILKSIDEFLIGKQLGNYTLELAPEKAFGERKRELVKTMPSSIFKKQNLNPAPGMVFSFDNALGKISTISGGRIVVDFNNPLAGKIIVYNLKLKHKIKKLEDKINALQNFFFRKQFKFRTQDKKLIFEKEAKIADFFKDKFKEIIGLDIELDSSDKKQSK